MFSSIVIIVVSGLAFAGLVAMAAHLIGHRIHQAGTPQQRTYLAARYDVLNSAGTVITALLVIETMIDAVWGSGSGTDYAIHLPIVVVLLVLTAGFWALGAARRWQTWQDEQHLLARIVARAREIDGSADHAHASLAR